MLASKKVNFFLAQQATCCNGKNCLSYNSCNAHRHGILCGQCQHGYVEGLFSTNCVEKAKCGSVLIFPVVLLIGLGCIIFLMHIREISFLIKHIFRYKKTQSRKRNSLSYTDQLSNDTSVPIGMVKVVFFFYQMIPLLAVQQSISSQNLRGKFFRGIRRIRSSVIDFMNFQIHFLCPFKSITPIKKQIFTSFVPISLLFWLLLILICYLSLKQLRKRCPFNAAKLEKKNDETQSKGIKFKARLLSCLLHLILLTYSTMTKLLLSLIHCVQIEKSQVLYIDGTVSCYSTGFYLGFFVWGEVDRAKNF